MSATDRKGARRPLPRALRYGLLGGLAWTAGVASLAYANDTLVAKDAKVATLLKTRLPKTALTKVDCAKVDGLCEVTSGANLFYVDGGGRYLVIGRVYDMETRQDLTATRLLEINPDLLVGGAARANAAADSEATAAAELEVHLASAPKSSAPSPARRLPVETLPKAGAIVWGNPTGKTVTVFSDFRCGYCRALTNTLKGMNLRVVERPISVLGSRDIANRVYCAKDREKALHAAYAGETIPAGPTCDTSGLDANERFAKQHGLGGTPVIVRADGAMIEGFRPRQVLVSWIAGGEA